MDKKNFIYPFCLSIDKNGFAYCSTHNHCSGLFFMDELLCMKEAIEKTIFAYKKEGVTDSYIEDEDRKAMEVEFSRINRSQKDARGVIVDDLYLIQDTCTNLLKIGRSKNVESRKRTMQTATGNMLELLFVIKGYGYKELELHDKFAKYRKHGEWFEYDKTIIDEFISLGGIVRESTYTNKEKELKEKFASFVLSYKKAGGRVRGIDTEFEEFSKRHKDWKQVIPYLELALQREVKARNQAKTNKTFFPEIKNLRTYLGKQRAWELYVSVDEDLDKINNEYLPEQSPMLMWNDYYQCYLYTGYWDGHISDGYSDDDRPNGASVTLNNGRGTIVWNKETKKWVKK